MAESRFYAVYEEICLLAVLSMSYLSKLSSSIFQAISCKVSSDRKKFIRKFSPGNYISTKRLDKKSLAEPLV